MLLHVAQASQNGNHSTRTYYRYDVQYFPTPPIALYPQLSAKRCNETPCIVFTSAIHSFCDDCTTTCVRQQQPAARKNTDRSEAVTPTQLPTPSPAITLVVTQKSAFVPTHLLELFDLFWRLPGCIEIDRSVKVEESIFFTGRKRIITNSTVALSS